MTTLHLKNFGPIVDSGILTLSTINLLIGPQGSGKSSVLKVLFSLYMVRKKLS